MTLLKSLESSPMMSQMMGMLQMQLMSTANGRELSIMSLLPFLCMLLPLLPNLLLWLCEKIAIQKSTRKKLVVFPTMVESFGTWINNATYDALFWYLTTQIDLDEDNAIVVESTSTSPLKINKHALDDTLFRFTFEDRTIVGVLKSKKEEVNDKQRVITQKESIELKGDNLDAFVLHVCQKHEETFDRNVYDPKCYNYHVDEKNWLVSRWTNTRLLKHVAMPSKMHKLLMNEFDTFQNNAAWYTQIGISRTLGILLSGPPGTGKTSFVQSLAGELKRHIAVVNLKLVHNDKDFFKMMSSLSTNDTVLVFEEIDTCGSVALKRRKDNDLNDLDELLRHVKSNEKLSAKLFGTEQKTLTLDEERKLLQMARDKDDFQYGVSQGAFLNWLQGTPAPKDGRVVVLTTNHPEKLDPAIVRPGRIDLHLHFDVCNDEMIVHFYNLFFPDYALSQCDQTELAALKLTPATVLSVFRRNRNAQPETLKQCLRQAANN